MDRYTLTATLVALLLIVPAGPDRLAAQADHAHRGGASCDGGGDECAVEDRLLSILRTRGVRPAMETLDSLAATSEDVRRDGHGYAHAIGIAAYTGDEEVGEVFARCTPAFQSGCYHGVIQAYFTEYQREHGDHLESDAVNALCRTHRETQPDRWLLFQCAHGMGHGMLMIADNHLPSALAGCDLIAHPWERESCYGGVFMENIVHETMPHHAIGRPETAGGGHAHGAGTAVRSTVGREPFAPLRKEDPLHPCTALEARYLTSCYQMQTSAVLYFNGSDVADAAATCMRAPEPYRPICFQSLGRDVSSITLQDHARAMRLCATAPAEYEPWCTIGYTKNLVDVTADPADGFAYCQLLPAGESKRVCNVAVGEQIWVLVEDPERREAMCAGADPEYLDDCRHGAGLIDLRSARAPAAGDRARRG